jgi:hypothetical protein
MRKKGDSPERAEKNEENECGEGEKRRKRKRKDSETCWCRRGAD